MIYTTWVSNLPTQRFGDSTELADDQQQSVLDLEWGTYMCPPLLFNDFMFVGPLKLSIVSFMPWHYHLLLQGSQEGWSLQDLGQHVTVFVSDAVVFLFLSNSYYRGSHWIPLQGIPMSTPSGSCK